MSGVDIAIVVVVCVAVVAAAGVILYRKLKHKGGCCDCGSDCGGNCAHCKGIQSDKPQQHK